MSEAVRRSRFWPPTRTTVKYVRIASVVWWLAFAPLLLIQDWPLPARLSALAALALLFLGYTIVLDLMARRRGGSEE